VTTVATIAARDGTRLAYEEAGAGIPVVGLHGLTSTRRYVFMGSRQLERSGHRVLVYDARGHGSSSPAPRADAYGYERLCEDLETVLDTAGIERALLVGVSMGAHTLLRFALRNPQRAAALVLITPGYDPEHERMDGHGNWRTLAAALRADGIDGFIRAYELDSVPERWRETVSTAIRQRLALHEHLEAVADALDVVPYSHPFDGWDALATIGTPTLVIGSRDDADRGHPLELARRYADAIPGAQFVVEDPGSSPLAWQGGRISRLVADLAARS
jgi:pimeloyl-ACP methyl ester carboxylesterase